ncbi:MAG: hypothetical protein ACJ8LN_02645, partial [Sulfurifustis sp.]
MNAISSPSCAILLHGAPPRGATYLIIGSRSNYIELPPAHDRFGTNILPRTDTDMNEAHGDV